MIENPLDGRSFQDRSDDLELTTAVRASADLGKLLSTLTASAGASQSTDSLQKALIAQAVEWYFWQSRNVQTPYIGQEFYTANGGLRSRQRRGHADSAIWFGCQS
jgi:hypothetical protein